MPTQRVLNCPVARTAAILGHKWTPLILRDFLMNGGVRRYHELLESLGGIAPNTLSDRLKTLEAARLIERRFYDQHPPRAEYVLTEQGRDLGHIVRAMRDFGEKYPQLGIGKQ